MTNNEKALMMHEQWNGKIETTAKSHVNSRDDLAIAYTPGVAEPCKVIAEDPEAAYKYTMKANTVAVVSDGSAVLGLGNIGALAAMPVMEGKAVLFKEFGGVNAVPICLDTLSIIAYKQPVTKLEIEKIRGVKSDHAVNKLVEYDLVCEVGRLDAPGKPILFGTTEEFLRRFSIQSADDLPTLNPEQVENFKEEAEEEIQLKLDI